MWVLLKSRDGGDLVILPRSLHLHHTSVLPPSIAWETRNKDRLIFMVLRTVGPQAWKETFTTIHRGIKSKFLCAT